MNVQHSRPTTDSTQISKGAGTTSRSKDSLKYSTSNGKKESLTPIFSPFPSYANLYTSKNKSGGSGIYTSSRANGFRISRASFSSRWTTYAGQSLSPVSAGTANSTQVNSTFPPTVSTSLNAPNMTGSFNSVYSTIPSANITSVTTTKATADCTSLDPSASATDIPASVDPGTGLLFRSSCGVTNATVAQCPYLCSRAGGGFFRECENVDITGEEPTGQFPPILCTHCLPPCTTLNTSSSLKS